MTRQLSPNTKGPLRKIVATLFVTDNVYGANQVRLECGHEVWCSPTAYLRARCRHCKVAAESPPAQSGGQESKS